MGALIAHATALTIAAAGVSSVEPPPDPMEPSSARDDLADDPLAPTPAMKIGRGLMLGGGGTMALGAGVLLPISMHMLLETPAPDPDAYTSADAFRRDVDVYRAYLDRATNIAVAGAVVGAVGAATFLAGAVTWGAGRHRMRRRLAATERGLSLSMTGSRRGFAALARWRF